MDDRWRDTKAAFRGGCRLVGVVAIVGISLHEGSYIAAEGLSAWGKHGIPGLEFVLMFFVAVVLLWVLLNLLFEGVNVVLDDRRDFYEACRDVANAREAKGLLPAPPERGAWIRWRLGAW